MDRTINKKKAFNLPVLFLYCQHLFDKYVGTWQMGCFLTILLSVLFF